MGKTYLNIQCTDSTGQRKTFGSDENNKQITPSFNDLVDLLDYLHVNNIKHSGIFPVTMKIT